MNVSICKLMTPKAVKFGTASEPNTQIQTESPKENQKRKILIGVGAAAALGAVIFAGIKLSQGKGSQIIQELTENTTFWDGTEIPQILEKLNGEQLVQRITYDKKGVEHIIEDFVDGILDTKTTKYPTGDCVIKFANELRSTVKNHTENGTLKSIEEYIDGHMKKWTDFMDDGITPERIRNFIYEESAGNKVMTDSVFENGILVKLTTALEEDKSQVEEFLQGVKKQFTILNKKGKPETIEEYFPDGVTVNKLSKYKYDTDDVTVNTLSEYEYDTAGVEIKVSNSVLKDGKLHRIPEVN